jgi:hypothetical protein
LLKSSKTVRVWVKRGDHKYIWHCLSVTLWHHLSSDSHDLQPKYIQKSKTRILHFSVISNEVLQHRNVGLHHNSTMDYCYCLNVTRSDNLFCYLCSVSCLTSSKFPGKYNCLHGKELFLGASSLSARDSTHFMEPKGHCCRYKSPSVHPILSQINLFHILTFHFLHINFNVVFTCLPNGLIPSDSSCKISCVFLVSCMLQLLN